MKKKVLIIGSGPTGITALNFLNKKYNLYLCDGGNINSNLKNKIKLLENISFKYFEPKYQIARKVFNNFFKLKYKNFFNSSAIISGGLSNFWGGGLEKPDAQFFNKHNLNKNYNKSFKDINKLMGLLNKGNLVSKNLFKSIINNFQTKKNKFVSLSENNLAITSENNKYRVFNSFKLFTELKKKKKINYLNKLIVKKIMYNKKKYKVIFSNNKYFYFDKIICCAGTIGSTKIVLDLFNINNIKIRLFHNHMFQLAFFNLNINFKNLSSIKTNIFIPYLLLKAKIYNQNHAGTLMFGNNIPKNIFKSYFINLISMFFKSRILIGNFFVNQYLSNTYIIKKNNYYEITSNTKKNNTKINIIKNIIKNFLYINKFIPLPFLNFKTFKNGSDSHYSSTIYNLKLNKKRIFKKNLELKKFKNFFVLDNSTMPPGLNFPTYFCMARAAQIAKSI